MAFIGIDYLINKLISKYNILFCYFMIYLVISNVLLYLTIILNNNAISVNPCELTCNFCYEMLNYI
jgi:hypothetical protein